MAREQVGQLDFPTELDPKLASQNPCPRRDLHTAGQPSGYLAWHEWAEKKSKRHRQVRCPGCTLFEIWVPK